MYNRRNLLAGLGAASLGAFASRGGAAEPAAAAGNRRRIPNVELKTHTGATVNFYDDLLRGKIVTVNMMYADCEGICPLMTNNLVRVQQLLGERVGKDIFMYSITLRPEQDTAQDLADYAEMHGVNPGWLFLTGARQDVQRLRYAPGFYDPEPALDRDITRHTGMVRIGNDDYDRWAMAPALSTPEQIVASILHVDRRAFAPGKKT